jgi:pimeloyl-ACP methyl ester carboxylesterase
VWGDEICSTWPIRAADPYRGPFNRVRTPILVVNTTFDPSTPIANARKIVRELGGGARLVTVDGYGHTVFLNPSACAARAQVDYLVELRVPREGTVCRQDRAPFATVAAPA